MEHIQSEVDTSFSRNNINYSMVWEDPELLLQSQPELQSRNILSISSAGDNALSLLSQTENTVLAIDMSEPQNHLLELKKVALKLLNRDQYLQLFDYIESTPEERLKLFQDISPSLSQKSSQFWQQEQGLVANGIIHCGKLEAYFQKFHKMGISKLFKKKDLSFLLNNKDLQLQKEVITSKTPLITGFIEDFFNQGSFSKEGRSEAQYKYVEKGLPIEAHIVKRTLAALQTHLISENSYMHYIFAGKFNPNNLPDHLTPVSFERIQNNIDKLEIMSTDLESLISTRPDKFDFFNLSDLFEYVSEEHFEKILKLLHQKSSAKARIAYWTLFVDREPSNQTGWTRKADLSNKMQSADRVWFYKNFNVLEKS